MPLQRQLQGEQCGRMQNLAKKRGWLQTLARKPVELQVEVLNGCSSEFIQDLHNLIHFVVYDKNLKISEKYRVFLKKHRTFLRNFIEEDNLKKKKANLIRKVKGGFLGILIPSLITLAAELFAK